MGVVIEPDPAPEGGRVTVTVSGNGPYYYRTGGSTDGWTELPVDAETGTATIDVTGSPPQSVDVSNRDGAPPDSASAAIVSTD